MILAAINPTPAVSMWPFVVLVVSLVFTIVMISVLRVHAFLALIAAAILAGLMAEQLPGAKPRVANVSAQSISISPDKPLKNHWVRAVELTTEEFGRTAGAIGVVIGLACIISICLMESGAADKVVRRFLAFFGEKRAGIALLVSTYILSIPIFFDTMFMLMLPLAMALSLRTGKDYLLYVLAICCGGVLTHSLTVPHPGPLAMVENLKIDVGFSILAGILGGIIPAIGGWFVAKWMNAKMKLPLRETTGASLSELKILAARPESELPSFTLAILPVLLPVILISLASLFDVANRSVTTSTWAGALVNLCGGPTIFSSVHSAVEFIGNKNIGLLLGAVIAVAVLARQKKLGLDHISKLLEPSLATAGLMILITSAGGAFGLMLRNAGVGEAIQACASGRKINLILLSYVVAFVIRAAQGSATIAMLTTSAMVYPIMTSGGGIPYNPIYIYLAIGFGAFAVSWMNDSGFWVVSKFSGFTERETLRSWTILLTAISVIGLFTTLFFATILPLK